MILSAVGYDLIVTFRMSEANASMPCEEEEDDLPGNSPLVLRAAASLVSRSIRSWLARSKAALFFAAYSATSLDLSISGSTSYILVGQITLWLCQRVCQIDPVARLALAVSKSLTKNATETNSKKSLPLLDSASS